MAVKKRVGKKHPLKPSGLAYITGQDELIANLDKEIKAMKQRSRAGMTEAALIVKAESMELTPVEFGNLKGSAFIEIIETLKGIAAIIGYTARYAIYVHEILDVHHIVGQARFLATALVVKAEEVLDAIARHVRLN